jgi:hypothetical protein
MREYAVVFPDGHEVDVAEMTRAEIDATFDALDRYGRYRIIPDGPDTLRSLRERLLIELTAREIGCS